MRVGNPIARQHIGICLRHDDAKNVAHDVNFSLEVRGQESPPSLIKSLLPDTASRSGAPSPKTEVMHVSALSHGSYEKSDLALQCQKRALLAASKLGSGAQP